MSGTYARPVRAPVIRREHGQIRYDREIVSAISGIVVAEQIEEPATLDILIEMGIE